MKKIKVFILSLCLVGSVLSVAQKVDYPVVGSPCPEFTVIDHKTKSKISLTDFNTKPLIVYFFSSGCSASFDWLSKVDKIKAAYDGKIDFLMIGREDKRIRTLYNKFQDRFKLSTQVAIDSAIFKRFGVRVLPHVVWFSKDHVVQAITMPDVLSPENLQKLMDNKPLNLPVKPNRFQEAKDPLAYDNRTPLLTNNNGGLDTAFLYRSMLTKWTHRMGTGNIPFVTAQYGNSVQVVGATLGTLYLYAYGDTTFHTPMYNMPSSYGKLLERPILEVRDTLPFTPDFANEKNLYSYSLIVPKSKSTTSFLQQVMQDDLKKYFGYHVRIETRKMPYWKLTATPEAREKLKTKGGRPYFPFDDYADFTLINAPVGALIDQLWLYHYLEPAFVDETGITGNIDLHVDAFSSDSIEAINRELMKNGLQLIKSEKEMRVIVISD